MLLETILSSKNRMFKMKQKNMHVGYWKKNIQGF